MAYLTSTNVLIMQISPRHIYLGLAQILIVLASKYDRIAVEEDKKCILSSNPES